MTKPKGKIKPMTPGIPHSARVRAYLAGAVVTVGLCGVAWRAWALQVNDGEHYKDLAERQHAMTVDIPAPRGDVIDAHGRPLAVSADADSIWANPRDVRDVAATADRLAKLTGEDAAVLEAKLAGDHRFVWIDRHVAPQVAKAVRDAKLPGIEVAKEPRRWYPAKTSGGPVIGRADIDGKGLDGIELSMNEQLLGQHGEGTALRDARGRKMFADGLAQPEPGATVQLSLDRSIQAMTDAALETAVTQNAAKSGVAVVLDVATGRVMAMASYPTFDPNGEAAHNAAARNRPVTDAFEAGSVMKLFTIAAALEAGTVRPDTEFDVENGAMMMPGRRAPIRDVHPFKYLSVADIIKHSSNIGAAKIALGLGRTRLYAALKQFGFGAKTQIELPGEQVGKLRDGVWRDVELATVAYGYGITVTPLQVAAGVAAIGNGGVYHAPRIVDRIVDGDGTVLYAAASEPKTIMSPKTADQMLRMMARVFEGGKEGGTAKDIVVPGFVCGGKTGTAHKYDPAVHGYSETKYLSSFVGLAPIDHPRLAIVVMIDEPSGGDHYGGKVAGPVFATVASEALRYLGVPGSTLVCPPPVPGALPGIAPKTCTVPSPLPPKPTPALATAAKAAPPADPAPLPAIFTTAAAPPTPSGPSVPDFRGMGVGRALDVAREASVAIEVTGSGRVIEQDPAPGAPLTADRIHLRFSDGNSLTVRPSPPTP